MKTILLAASIGVGSLFLASTGRAVEPLARWYEARAAASRSYRLPPEQVRAQVEQLLHADGYDWPEGAPERPLWQTDWRCRGDACDRLTVTSATTPAGTAVTIRRVRREGATDSQIEWSSLASDLEWRLYEQLDPVGARRTARDAAAQAAAQKGEGTAP